MTFRLRQPMSVFAYLGELTLNAYASPIDMQIISSCIVSKRFTFSQ